MRESIMSRVSSATTEAAALGPDVDLGLVAVLLDGQDDVDVEDVVDEALQPGQALLAIGLDLGRRGPTWRAV
ncbi:MAG: hypothetical protein MZV64_49690 [Ignavibacteriales bacterium]|nr:hypothetical protein [Ignavibacteriales bacterium]